MRAKKLSDLSNLLIISKESLRQLEEREEALNFNLKYWLKTEKIISLKKGLYVTKDRWERETNKDLYLEYLANKIYEQSYLSAEYVMSKYGLLTEAVYTLTSIAIRKTKSFKNKLGIFNYYSISEKLFKGFKIKKFYSSPVFIASKSKAIFDFLYLRFIKKTPINSKVITELRINWENVGKDEFEELKFWTDLSKSKRMREVLSLIKKEYYA